MRIKNKVLQKIVSVTASVLFLINSFTPYLLIAPTLNQVRAQEEPVASTEEPILTPAQEEITSASTTEITPTEVATPTPTVEITPTIEETPVETITPTETPALEPTEAPSVPSPPIVTPEPTPIQTPSQWTFEKVELNKEYIAPQNSEVKLTFTKLPDPAGSIKIEEITLTEDQIKQTGSLSDKAYDITSDMKDGDFSYNLSLPIPESSKGKSIEVKFAEEISNIGSAEKIENDLTKTDASVSISSLDHFTIFVVTGASATATITLVNDLLPDWSEGVFSAYVGPHDYDYVSPGTTGVRRVLLKLVSTSPQLMTKVSLLSFLTSRLML
ncbi:MAG: Cellulose binding domain-containing protein [Candidatus Gottesmanbacteria bacterium GW2011_GWC2_39_8]|uniref:Cellulose binding domain-containing protein n=1 Tax=Candidatus Gottesmanbacteria bacterium GW2011_GWC2_39_8 TaxID=1618450 RepID=A0A0G0T037_9BACT|nr:MAG: Cellulose binding domain-containing protein [Candidatus Gottesmanbacteria bacterium GW2011_GWC2_39_8]